MVLLLKKKGQAEIISPQVGILSDLKKHFPALMRLSVSSGLISVEGT